MGFMLQGIIELKEDKMKEVTKEEFYNFLKDKETTIIDGEWMHSDYWLDDKANKIAYRQTSSYGADTIYKIDKK